MSVLINDNGSLVRQDAAAIAQLAAVDTEGILGGTPGAITDGQTLVDQLAADDVQAQTDIGQIKTDLSDYHVVPSRNLCPFYTNVVGGFTYTPDENGYTSCSSDSDTRNWSYSVSNILFRLPAGLYHLHVFTKTAYTSGYTGARLYDSANNLIGGLANFDSDMGFDFTLAATTDLGLIYKLGNGSYAFMVSTASNWSVKNTYEPYYVCMRDGMFPRLEQRVLGAKNLLPRSYTGSTTQGVTYAVNANDELTATWSNTPTGSAIITYTSARKMNFKVGKRYKVTGCPVGGAWSTTSKKYRIYLYDSTNSAEVAVDTGDGAEFIATNVSYAFFVVIGTDAGASGNLTFKPMITIAEDTDSTFAPFAMTNRELTPKKETVTGTTSASGNLELFTKTNRIVLSAYSVGKICTLLLANANGQTMVHVTDAGASPSTVISQSVTVTYYYIDL